MIERRSLLAVGGGLAALVALAGQVIAAALRPPSPLETLLFATLQIAFVAYAAYVVAQEAAARAFLAHQKRVGYGVLRRVREVSETLGRLQGVVRQKKELLARSGRIDPELTLEYLEHILSVAEELKGKVLASREDWQEVFAEEIRQLRDIEELSRRRRAERDEARRRQFDVQIDALRAGLPVTIQALVPHFRELVAPADGERPTEEARSAGRVPAATGRAKVKVAAAGKKGQAVGNGAPRETAPVA